MSKQIIGGGKLPQNEPKTGSEFSNAQQKADLLGMFKKAIELTPPYNPNIEVPAHIKKKLLELQSNHSQVN